MTVAGRDAAGHNRMCLRARVRGAGGGCSVVGDAEKLQGVREAPPGAGTGELFSQ